jgi:hypothetical protein
MRRRHARCPGNAGLPTNISFWGFDLDDISPHLAHDLGAIGAKHDRGQINDTNAL